MGGFGGGGMAGPAAEKPKEVIKEGLSEYFLFTIEGREDIQDQQPIRLVSMNVADVPLECIYKLTDRDDGDYFTKFYRFKNEKLPTTSGTGEETCRRWRTWALSPLPDGQGAALFRIRQPGPGLRGRHRNQIRADRRPRGSKRRSRTRYHDACGG